MQGPGDKLSEMRQWLGSVGSPASAVTRLDVTGERPLAALEFTAMERRPNVP